MFESESAPGCILTCHTKCRLLAGCILRGLLVSGLYCGRAGRALKTKYSPLVNIDYMVQCLGDEEDTFETVCAYLLVRKPIN